MSRLAWLRGLAGLLLLLAFEVTAKAQNSETAIWSEIGGWRIGVDRTVGSGCFALNAYGDGSLFRIGFAPNTKNMYMLVANPKWKSLEIGKIYDLVVTVSGESPWTAKMTAMQLSDLTTLVAYTKESKFFIEVMRKQNITFSYRGRIIANLSLRGSMAASLEMLRCQQAMTGSTTAPPQSDPFATPRRRSQDPFSY